MALRYSPPKFWYKYYADSECQEGLSEREYQVLIRTLVSPVIGLRYRVRPLLGYRSFTASFAVRALKGVRSQGITKLTSVD